MPRLARLLLAAVLLCPGYLAAGLPDIIDKVRPSVVGVGTARPVKQPGAKGPPVRFLGSGFAVGDGSLIVTNYHVVTRQLDADNKETIAVFSGRGNQSKVHAATVVASDPQRDLALLRVPGLVLPALELHASESVREGQEVAFTGFPIGVVLGLYPVTHRGIVSVITPTVIPAQNASQLSAAQLQRMRQPFNVIQLDATAYPGNSGSPVYEIATGKVIGVLNSVFIKETKEAVLEKPSGISYAIPATHVQVLLQQAKEPG